MTHTGLTFCVVLAGFLSAIITPSCKKPTEPPPPGEQPVSFSAIDASCTEIWLEVKFHPDARPRTIEIKRDTLSVLTTTLTGTDTLIVDEGLLPHREYTYTLTRPGVWQDRPLTATITTMDTSSSNWVFDQPVLLGDGGGSVLHDVAIINDTLAYAVGEIYKRDSLGNWDPNAYNLVKWNGNTWQLMRIQFYTFCGQPGTGSYPARGVLAFGPNDVWIASGSQVIRWNGQSQTAPMCTPVSINKLWGDSSTGELYAVGNGGGIAIRSPSGTWRRLESGTGLAIRDVYGARDPATGEYEILCVAEAYGVPGGSKILSIEGNNVHEIATSGLESWGVGAIWFVPHRRYIVGGQGVWQSFAANGHWRFDSTLPNLASTSISGEGLNSVSACGAFWLLATWNGVRWQTHFPRTSSGALGGVEIKGDLLVAVGFLGNSAVAIQGRR